jgi:hypothetical protein
MCLKGVLEYMESTLYSFLQNAASEICSIMVMEKAFYVKRICVCVSVSGDFSSCTHIRA